MSGGIGVHADERERQPLCYVPPGWPGEVRPPGAPDWERTASAFLLDCCPPEYRGYPVLRRHPVVLARFAIEYVTGELRTTRDGLARLRAGLADVVDGRTADAAVDVWQEQLAVLTGRRRAVGLVEEALRGHAFVRKL